MLPDIFSTKGGVNSNSYAGLDETIDYLDMFYGADGFYALGEDDKLRLLFTATRYIDRLPVKFPKLDATQTLKFPVDTGQSSIDGFDQAKEATMVQAFYLMVNTDNILEGATGAIQGVKSETLGPTSKQITGYNPLRKWAPDALIILAPFIDFSLQIYRG